MSNAVSSASAGAAAASAGAAAPLSAQPGAARQALWVCVAGALSFAVAMGIGRFAFTPLLPLMVRAGELDVALGGWLAAANYAGYLVGALTAARLRVSPLVLAFGALVGIAAGTAAMGVWHLGWLWLALRFAAGVWSAWAFVGINIWCLGAVAAWGKPAWGGLMYVGVGCGIALAGLYCLLGSAAGGTADGLWLQLGALALALLLAAAVLARGRVPASVAVAPQRVRPAAQAGQGGTAARAPAVTVPAPRLPARTLRGMVICYGMAGFGYILPATFLPLQARALVDNPLVFGLAWPVFGATAALSAVLAGWALRHYTRLQVWIFSQVLMGVGVLLPSLWLNMGTIALAALFVGGTFIVVTLAGVQEARALAPGNPTALVSRMTAAFALGQLAGPIVSTVLTYLHIPVATALDVALQIAAAGLLLSAGWLWRYVPKDVHP